MNKYLTYIITLLITSNVLAISCYDSKTECIEAGGTRMVNGVSVTLDCWHYKTTSKCKKACDNNCQILRDQGCALVSTTCRGSADGICQVQDSVFSCPTEQCTESGSVVCGKAPFCMDGSCTTTKPKTNHHFAKATAMLAALNDAAKQISKKQINNPKKPFIFAGTPAECSCGALNTVRCCGSGKGWAQGIVGCKESEQNLAINHEKGLTIAVGEYCYERDPILHSCLSRHKVYCVFDSKIARIVQHDGRYKQLRRSFGYAGGDRSRPDCTGISIKELQKLDFSKMDFSALYAEIKKNIDEKSPINGKFKTTVAGHSSNDINKKMQQGMPEVGANNRVAERVQDFYDRIKQ